MSDIKDVNFQDEPLAGDYRVPTPKGIKNTNGEEWVCDEGEHEQPYPIVNEAGYITRTSEFRRSTPMIGRNEPRQMWDAPYASACECLARPGSKAWARGSLSVSAFKHLPSARRVWSV
jgi:hypothetical protein